MYILKGLRVLQRFGEGQRAHVYQLNRDNLVYTQHLHIRQELNILIFDLPACLITRYYKALFKKKSLHGKRWNMENAGEK